MRPTTLALAALLSVMLLPQIAVFAAEPPAPPQTPFANKIVYVLLDHDGGHAYLVNTRTESLGGKTFLVGDSVDPTSALPIKGVAAWLATDHILRLTTFDTREALFEQLQQKR